MWRCWTPGQRAILTLVTTTSLALAVPVLAQSTGWDLIGAVGITEIEEDGIWRVEKTYPPGLENGATLTVSGYFVPMMAQGYQTQFLLVPDPADCPFCGTNGYGPTLEVHAATPLPDLPEGATLTVTGTVELVDSPETYQALRLRNADWALGSG